MKKSEILGTVFVLIAGILWGSSGIFVRFFTGLGMSAIQISIFKCAFAPIFLLLYCLIFKRELLKINKKDLWIFAGAGFISMDFFTLCYFSTIQTTSLSVAAVLLYAAPAMVMLMSIVFFKEKLSGMKCLACALAFLGCVLTAGILGSGTSIPPSSLLTGLLSAFGYALYSIFGRIAIDKGYNPLTMTTYTFLFAGIGALLFLKPGEVIAAATSGNVLVFVAMTVGITLVVSILPYVFYTTGLTYIVPSKASIIASIEPVAATVIGALLFREIPTLSGAMGIVCVVGAIVLLNIKTNKSVA